MTNPQRSLEKLLTQGRKAVEVEPKELDEARHRRTRLGDAVRQAFPGARLYNAGSIAHGDALTPLTDVDLGGVVPPALAESYGPGRTSPWPLMVHARDAISDVLAPEYPKLRVTIEGQNHAVLVSFGDPVTPDQPDFTADVIIAIDNPTGTGLYIPALRSPLLWEPSDPEAHTRLIVRRVTDTQISFAHVVRLLKHWARQHDNPLCSWHIKVLALQCITARTPQYDGLLTWFQHAHSALLDQPTPDPAHISPGIYLSNPQAQVLAILTDATRILLQAREEAMAGRMANAQQLLAELLPNAIPEPPAPDTARDLTAGRLAAGSVTLLAGARHATSAPKPVRSWHP